MGKTLDIQTVLDRIDALVVQLRKEPWGEYDATITGACTLLTKQAFRELQKVAKAVSRITPEESQDEAAWVAAATTRIVAAEPWFEHILDEMK